MDVSSKGRHVRGRENKDGYLVLVLRLGPTGSNPIGRSRLSTVGAMH